MHSCPEQEELTFSYFIDKKLTQNWPSRRYVSVLTNYGEKYKCSTHNNFTSSRIKGCQVVICNWILRITQTTIGFHYLLNTCTTLFILRRSLSYVRKYVQPWRQKGSVKKNFVCVLGVYAIEAKVLLSIRSQSWGVSPLSALKKDWMRGLSQDWRQKIEALYLKSWVKR